MNRVACFEAGKAAQLLVQFPPYLERDDAHLKAFLDKLPRHHRYVVEFRHKSWMVPEVFETLSAHGMAFCIHDYPELRTGEIVTSPDLAYIRLHGHEALYTGSYPRRSLRYWAQRIRKLSKQAHDVFIYFNNDVRAAAPHDAALLKRLLADELA